MPRPFRALLAALLCSAPGLAFQEAYRLPPKQVAELLEAPTIPSVRPSPDAQWLLITERPALLINDGRLIASNSMLCGYLRKGTPAALAAAWFTSLTLLQLELQIHSLGGIQAQIPDAVRGQTASITVSTKWRGGGRDDAEHGAVWELVSIGRG